MFGPQPQTPQKVHFCVTEPEVGLCSQPYYCRFRDDHLQETGSNLNDDADNMRSLCTWQISSDFSVSRVLSEKLSHLKFGVFQHNQPTAEVSNSCCVRSQRGKCCVAAKALLHRSEKCSHSGSSSIAADYSMGWDRALGRQSRKARITKVYPTKCQNSLVRDQNKYLDSKLA
jgi:hypothetical protein